MHTLFLTRHGETSWNRQGNRYCGVSDISLSEEGIRQAHRLAGRLQDNLPGLIIASPLSRSRQTAEILAGELDIPMVMIPDFREIDFGHWEGRTPEDLAADPCSSFSAWEADPENTPIPGGESAPAAQLRVWMAFQSLVQNPNTPDTVLLVGHNTANRLLLARLLHIPLSFYRRITQSNGNLTVLTRDQADGMRVQTLNETGFQHEP